MMRGAMTISGAGDQARDEGPAESERWRSPGWWLQVTGVAHAAVAAALYRDAFAEIAADRVLGSVPDRGDRATAFWFGIAAPTLWLAGYLLRSAESTGDIPAQRIAGATLLVTGSAGSIAMPVSGLWAVAAIGVAALRRAAGAGS